MSTAAGLSQVPFLIAGEWVRDPSSYLTHVNPATGKVNDQVCAGTEAHIDRAVKSAHEAARQSAWRNILPHERAQLLHRIADLMIEHSDLLARCQMVENDKVWKECKNQVVTGAATFRYSAAALLKERIDHG
jgi:betaine-aldehyde dehydrogenase